jgi:uncharacterized membrane-anchored protein
MKWPLSFLIIGVWGILIAVLNYNDPGQINVTWNGYLYQTTLVLALSVFTGLLFLLVVLLGFLGWVQRFSQHYKKSKEIKNQNELISLLTLIEAEMFTEAREKQKKSKELLENDLLFQWFSGNIYSKLGQSLEAKQCYFELTKNPATAFLGLKGAILSDPSGDKTLIEKAEKILPTSSWVLKQKQQLKFPYREEFLVNEAS